MDHLLVTVRRFCEHKYIDKYQVMLYKKVAVSRLGQRIKIDWRLLTYEQVRCHGEVR